MKRFWSVLVLGVCAAAAGCGGPGGPVPASAPAERVPGALEGQIVVDPDNGSYLVYNRDGDGDGELDPFFMIGPGDPEGFLYLGERQADGKRAGGRQSRILEQMREHGGNALYFQAVRSHGGDGADDHNPWNDPGNPASGLDPDVVRQWRGWFDVMRDAGITLFFFLYDDGAHPFDDGCVATVGADERAFIQALVDAFEDYPNLIWVTQEEFEEPKQCLPQREAKTRVVADLVRAADDHDHAIGVHHLTGSGMAIPDHPTIDVYVQQAGNSYDLEQLHAAGQPGTGFDPEHRYVYIMGEATRWHPPLLQARDRTTLRRSYYATALAGGYVTVLGMYPTEEGADPTPEMLADMRRMQRFFESTRFNRMAPRDDLAHAGTRWVLADPGDGYILYAYDGPERLGVKRVPPGLYKVRWFDPVTGVTIEDGERQVSGDAVVEKPDRIGEEVLVYLYR